MGSMALRMAINSLKTYTQIKKSVKVTEKTVIITENLLILGQQIVLLILAKRDCNFLVK